MLISLHDTCVTYHGIVGLSIILKNSFLSTHCDSRILKILCCKKKYDQHKLCYFPKLFSNFLILRALSVKKY